MSPSPRHLRALTAAGFSSQAALARRIGAGEAQVSQWFQGKRQPNPDNLRKLTRALGRRTVEELFPQ